MKSMIGEKSIILEAPHPSGRSANGGFLGCNHFNKVNQILIKQGKIGINWGLTKIQHHSIMPTPIINSNTKPNLSPINTDVLSSMITVKPRPNRGTPTILGYKQSAPQDNTAKIPPPIKDDIIQPTTIPEIPKINFGITKPNNKPLHSPITPAVPKLLSLMSLNTSPSQNTELPKDTELSQNTGLSQVPHSYQSPHLYQTSQQLENLEKLQASAGEYSEMTTNTATLSTSLVH